MKRLIVGLLLLAGCATVPATPSSEPYESGPQCDGKMTYQFYDTDGDKTNGPEIVIYRRANGQVLAVMEFEPGAEGKFKRATVGRQTFNDVRTFAEAYPGPCALLGETI